MQLGELRAAEQLAAPAGAVDQLPGAVPGGFLKVEPPVFSRIGWVGSRRAVISSMRAVDGRRIVRRSLRTARR